jgi:hypothetical protein
MKKTLLFILLITSNSFYGQQVIYETTHAGTTGVETTPASNGPACQMGDAPDGADVISTSGDATTASWS